jgi:hypothetical protein
MTKHLKSKYIYYCLKCHSSVKSHLDILKVYCKCVDHKLMTMRKATDKEWTMVEVE